MLFRSTITLTQIDTNFTRTVKSDELGQYRAEFLPIGSYTAKVEAGGFQVIEQNGRIVACGGLWDRGRDMREVWRSAAGEERRVEVAAALDLGCEAGREDALADLLRDFASRAAALGRQSLIADLEHMPDVTANLGDLELRWESRTLEWSPYLPALPRTLGECHLDLRYW